MNYKIKNVWYNTLLLLGLIALWCLDSAVSCQLSGTGCVYNANIMYRVAEGFLIIALFLTQFFINNGEK